MNMNATIHGIIDHMFKDIADNTETRALHEELLNNCLEHYDDLIQRGMSETEAIDAVVESLKGMKEVIDEYPKKQGSDRTEAKDEIPEIHAEQGQATDIPREKPAEYTCDPSGIKTLRTELKACNLIIGKSPDHLIHVRCEDMDQILCEETGSSLWIKAVDKTKQSIAEAGQKMSNEEFSLKGLLNFLGKAVSSVASSISVSWNVYIDLPDCSLNEMDLNAKSGDIEVKSILPEKLNIHTMSGDAKVESAAMNTASRMNISTMSGEIEVEGDADFITLSSMSGDVNARGSYQEAELKSTSGDVTLKGNVKKIRMSSVSGDTEADINNPDAVSIDGRSTSGDVEICLAPGTDSVHAAISTVSGSASCRIPDGGTGARLQIHASSVSGDVKIR